MKKILFSWSLLAIAFMNQTANAQCTVSNATIEVNNITPNGGNSCTINFDLSWTQEINGGNKFAYVHLWRSTAYHMPAAAWPAVNPVYSGPSRIPEAAQLANALLTIVIENNNTATPTIGTTYHPDASIVEFTSATISKTALNGTQERMTVGNISLSFTDCNASIALQGDIWASQASNGRNVHCASQGLSVVLNDPRVIGLKKCTTPRVFNVSVTTTSATNVNVYYKLYKDDGDGIFEPGAADALLTTSASFDISSSSPYIQENVAYPGNNVPGENSALWVEVLKTSGGTFSTVAYLASAACAPLPVDMKMFSAERNQSAVLLKWETMSEQNNSGFGVERNINGTWQQIAFVPTQAQGGNSNIILSYQYTDINTVKGITQYRIRQVDQDGRIKYSAIRAVRGENQAGNMIVYPNPSTDGTVNIVFSTGNVKRNVTIVDMSGRVVKQWKDVTTNNLQVTNLPTGIFTARIVDVQTGEQTVEKLIVNKR